MPLPRGAGVRAADAAVQLNAHLIFPGRVVGLRHVEHVGKVVGADAMRQLHDAARHIGAIGPPLLQPRQRIVEGHAGFRRSRRPPCAAASRRASRSRIARTPDRPRTRPRRRRSESAMMATASEGRSSDPSCRSTPALTPVARPCPAQSRSLQASPPRCSPAPSSPDRLPFPRAACCPRASGLQDYPV